MNIIQNAEVDRFIKEMGASGIDYFSVGFIKKDNDSGIATVESSESGVSSLFWMMNG